MEEHRTVKGTDIRREDTFHTSDYQDAYDFISPPLGDVKEPIERPKVCVFCNAEWTPRMEKIYVNSGYCETCWDSETANVVVCDNCNRIVYAK